MRGMKLCSIISLIVFVFAVGMAGDALGEFGNKVADTPHNLREATTGPMDLTDYGEICVYCHTPHNAGALEAPLWNRSTPGGPYSMYSSSTIDMDIAGSPQGVSLACLSCHDGSIALDAIINVPTAAAGATPSGTTIQNCAQNCHVGDTPAGSLNFEGTFLDTDLSNDHPISITYDPTKDPNFQPASGGKVGALPLYGASSDQVECASCHNAHDNSTRPFLRMSNDNSAMCLTCHDI